MSADASTPERRVVTQRDVAEAAGVDRATVSRALDPEKRALISPETVERVLDTAERMGYRTNLLARGLRTSRSGVIGLEIPPSINTAISAFTKTLSRFVTSVEERLRSQGHTLLVTFVPGTTSRAQSTLDKNGMIDGLIRLHPGNPLTLSTHFRVPVVTVGFEVDPAFDVVIDESHGIRVAVEHLHRLGHRRIGLVSEPPSHPRGERHVSAFEKALSDLEPVEPPSIAYFHERHPLSAPEAVASVIGRDASPTALLLTDDKAAMSSYGTLRSHQRSVPDHMSVVGWGDSDADLFLVPPLTTIAMPMRGAGIAAADMIVSRVSEETPGAREQRVLRPYLVQRASTAPPATGGAATVS